MTQKKKKKLITEIIQIELIKVRTLPKICSWIIRRRVQRNQLLRRVKKCDHILFIQVSFFTIVNYFIRFLIPSWHVSSLLSTDGPDCATWPMSVQFYTYNYYKGMKFCQWKMLIIKIKKKKKLCWYGNTWGSDMLTCGVSETQTWPPLIWGEGELAGDGWRRVQAGGEPQVMVALAVGGSCLHFGWVCWIGGFWVWTLEAKCVFCFGDTNILIF